MKIKYSYLILFLIIIFVSLQAVSASDVDDNQTILSNEMSKDTFGISIDINEKIGDSEGNFSELQSEVDRGGTINLDKNYTIGENEKEVVITKDIIINGNGYSINANFNSKIFDISNANVILNGITFVNGNNSNVITVSLSNITINNCNFTDNNVSVLSISNSNSTINKTIFARNNNTNVIAANSNLTVIDSVFNNNGGRGISVSGSDVLIDKSSFTNNHATNTGVYATNSYLNVLNSIFEDNIAWGTRNIAVDENSFYELKNNTFDYEAEIYTYNLKEKGNETVKIVFDDGTNLFLSQKIDLYLNNVLNTTFLVDNTKYFEYNFTDLDNGNYQISLNINDSANNKYINKTSLLKTFKINDNVLDVVYIKPEGSSTASGTQSNPTNWDNALKIVANNGTIVFADGTYNIINETIARNLTLNGTSDAIINAQQKGRIFTIKYNTLLTINGLTFTNTNTYFSTFNRANGGVFNIINSDLIIRNSTFKENNAYSGGVLTSSSTNISIIVENSVFKNNSALYGSVANIYTLESSNISFINSNFTNNTVLNDGGVFYLSGNFIYNFDKCNFTDNGAMNGGVFFLSNLACVNITGSNFNNNYANATGRSQLTYDGGGVFCIAKWNSGSVIAENTNFTNNTANAFGGVVVVRWDSLITIKFNNCNFTNNSAYAGGIYYGVCTKYNSILELTNSHFDKNHAIYGGILFFDSNSFNPIINNCSFDNNYATSTDITQTGYSGGGVLCISNWYGAKISILNSNFTNNTSKSHGGVLSIKWGSYLQIKNINITNCNFNNNSANSQGGVAYLGYVSANSILNITNSNFTNNNATEGGVFSSWNFNADNFNITKCNFKNNTATSAGGVINIYSTSKVNIIQCTFINNTANGAGSSTTQAGGGVLAFRYGASSSRVYVTNSEFYNNSAPNGGGGVFLTRWEFRSTMTITNSIFKNNNAKIGGVSCSVHANLNYNPNINFINLTFINNSAKNGGALYFSYNLPVNVTNCNFTNNTATNNRNINYAGLFNMINSTLDNTATVNVSDIYKGQSETISASAFNSGINKELYELTDLLINGESKGKISGNTYDLTFSDLNQGAYTVTLKDTNGNIYYYKNGGVFTVSGNDYFFISPNGTGIGITNLNPANLTYALSNINENKIIYFMDGIYTNLETISKKLSLIGYSNGAIISSTLTISSTVTIENLIFKNTNTAIQNTGTLTITNSTFTNNTINIAGTGSVDISNSIIRIDNSINDTFTDKTILLGNVDNKIANYNPIISFYINGEKETQSSFTRDAGVYNIKVNDTKGNIYKMDDDTFVVYTYTIYIAPDADGYGINETDPTTFDKAYEVAINGVTIHFANATYTIVDKTLAKDISLVGNATITANNQGNIFNIQANVNITNLTFTGAVVALNITSGTVNINNATFTKNTQAIYIRQGSVNIKDSVFDENTKTTYRNIENYGTIKIMNSTFDLANTLNMTDIAEGQTARINGTIDDGTNLDTYNLTVGNETRSVGKVISEVYTNLSIGYYNVTLVGSGTNSYRFKRELGFSVYGSKVYVSPNGTGYGSSINDTTSWQYAAGNLIRDDVEVIFTNGTYIIQSNVIRNYIKKLR